MDLDSLVPGKSLVNPLEQKERDWLEQRRGVLTGSRFGCLMGQGRGGKEFTGVGFTYLKQKVAERLGSFKHSASSKSMQWGKDNEAGAIEAYEHREAVAVDSEPYRLIMLSDDIGSTPDGLVGDDGCVEVKCPYDPAVHVNTLITGKVPSEYVWQVHGHMLVSNRQWCDFVSHDPRMEGPNRLKVIRVNRDPVKLEELLFRLDTAVKWIQKQVQMLEVIG